MASGEVKTVNWPLYETQQACEAQKTEIEANLANGTIVLNDDVSSVKFACIQE